MAIRIIRVYETPYTTDDAVFTWCLCTAHVPCCHPRYSKINCLFVKGLRLHRHNHTCKARVSRCYVRRSLSALGLMYAVDTPAVLRADRGRDSLLNIRGSPHGDVASHGARAKSAPGLNHIGQFCVRQETLWPTLPQ